LKIPKSKSGKKGDFRKNDEAIAEAAGKIFLRGGGQAEQVAGEAKFSLLLPSKHERNYF
jgi:hypothetical protein